MKKNLLIITKPSMSASPAFERIYNTLKQNPEVDKIYLEHGVHRYKFDDDKCDMVISLGGDGTVLYSAWRFQKHTIPIFSIHGGTLGFLSNFSTADISSQLMRLSDMQWSERNRLKCVLNGTETHVLNEVIIDRGQGTQMIKLNVSTGGKHLTDIHADGLIISTPTGSTAYSLSAGGSLVHPEAPLTMLTPICPHSLSFRPLILPHHMPLEISVSPDSPKGVSIAFDGRNRTSLNQNDTLIIVKSDHGIKLAIKKDVSTDWISNLKESLFWNRRSVKQV